MKPASGSLLDRIEAATPRLTRSERLIAAYLTANVRGLALENASSVARKAGVSAMTVGRFLRTLGYAHFDEIRREVGGDPASASWHVGDRYARFRHDASGPASAGSSLDREVGALLAAYELASGARWTKLVKRLASVEELYVAGFQTVRGVAMDFAARLEYLRDGVRFVDGANGTYAELFARTERITRSVC
jgi:DNA-binding MurR/RpiR family transcriptional regulator